MGGQAQALMDTSRKNLPKDADDWINMFITAAETFPACIVISDMTIPGAPMIYINPEFTRTTGYTSEEACGRNCRFLQVLALSVGLEAEEGERSFAFPAQGNMDSLNERERERKGKRETRGNAFLFFLGLCSYSF